MRAKGCWCRPAAASYLVALLGIRQVVLAVNKMDAVAFFPGRSLTRSSPSIGSLRTVGITDITAIPLSALRGDTTSTASANAPWYTGPGAHAVSGIGGACRRSAATAVPHAGAVGQPPHQGLPGFAGLIASGIVRRVAGLRVLPSAEAVVARIVTTTASWRKPAPDSPLNLVLDQRGGHQPRRCAHRCRVAVRRHDQFQATLVWMHERACSRPPVPVPLGTRTAVATITALRHKVNINTSISWRPGLGSTRSGSVNPDPGPPSVALYRDCRELGDFILIDRINDTVGAGMLHFALRRPGNIHAQAPMSASRLRCTQRTAAVHCCGLRAIGRRQIDHRQPRRALGTPWPPHHLLDGDSAPRAELGPRLHRRRPSTKHRRVGGRQARRWTPVSS